ncbi:MAG: hypothetical protein WCF95_02705, partial [bacterium]
MTDMMVQNSISQKSVEHKPSSTRSRIPTSADYEKYQLGATPYEAKGHLVHTPIWKLPVVAVEDTFESLNNIGKGLRGKSNDHELGLSNDISMKIGGLALAGYLATQRIIPAKKGMEFVGFASFFASMVLFPKLFINAPIKALYGFNVDQKCIDSQGRKNNLHRDPQYFASDLYSSEQLEAIGDKMHVDKDMENRQEFVKRKMTKISTQANTMWMLTAGLATPIMGALISSEIEKGLNKAQEAKKTKLVNRKTARLVENLANLDEIVKNKSDKKGFEALKTLLKNNEDKNVDDKFITKLVKILDKGSNSKLETNLRQDLENLLVWKEVPDVSEFIGEITLKVPKEASSKELVTHVFSKEAIKEALIKGKLNDNQEIKLDDIKKRLGVLFRKETEKYEDEDLFTALEKEFSSQLDAKLAKKPLKLTEKTAEEIEKIFKALDAFNVKNSVLAEYVQHKIGDREDSIKAREWKKASEGIMNAIGLSNKELEQIKKSPSSSRAIMEAKMSELAKEGNEAKYQKALEKIAGLINKFDEAMVKGSIKDGKGFQSEVVDMTGKFYDDLAKSAKDSSLNSVADYIAGNGSTLTASAKKNATEALDNSLLGAKSSLYKVVQGLDLFKRLENGSIKEELEKTFPKSKESVEQSIKAMKYAIMDGTYGDHFVKFNIEEPKVYIALMENLFGKDKLSKSTTDALGGVDSRLTGNVKKHINYIYDQCGRLVLRFKKSHFVGEVEKTLNYNDDARKEYTLMNAKGDLKNTTMVGETLSKFAQKSAEQIHNTNHWTRLFGGIGAGVAVVTLACPFFFGKINAPKKSISKE